MRKTISTLVLSLTAVTTAFADANYTARKNCWGFISWRYKTYANVWKKVSQPHLFADGSGSSTGCSGVVTAKYGYYVPILPGTMVAKGYASTGGYGNNSYTWLSPSYTSKFGAGLTTDMMTGDYSYAPMYDDPTGGNAANMEGTFADISNSDFEFDENSHTVKVLGLSGRIGVDDVDMQNAYATFKVWILNATGVADEEQAQVITTVQAFILNGKLVVEGDYLKDGDFTLEQEGKSIYKLSGADLAFQIPQSINLEDVIIKVGSDVGNLGDGIDPAYAINFNGQKYSSNVSAIKEGAKLNLDILGNPATNNLNFVVASGTKEFSNATISIYDNAGKIVKEVYEGAISNSARNFNVDIASLATGAYYLRVTTDTKEQFTRKFIKQ